MARHFYHIPLEKARHFIKTHRSELNAYLADTKLMTYHAIAGKGRWSLEIERFIGFFHIDDDIAYALRTMEYFLSKEFAQEMARILNFEQFSLTECHKNIKHLFFAFCHLYALKDSEAFALFAEKSFIRYHAPFNRATDVKIDYKEMSRVLAQHRGKSLKESFGENTEGSYFRLFLDGAVCVEEQGKSIKTLRKKAYRKLFRLLLDM